MKRPFCIIGLSFMAGAFAASYLPDSSRPAVILALLPGFFACLFLLKGKWRTSASTAFACVILGVSLFHYTTTQIYNQIVLLADQEVSVTATVTNSNIRDNGKYTYEMRAQHVATQVPQQFKFLLYSDIDLEVGYGDTITLTPSFFLPSGNSTFDGISYYKGQQIFLLAHTKGEGVAVTPRSSDSLSYSLFQARYALSRRIQETMPYPQSSVMESVILGIQDNLDANLKQNYINSGSIHLFAVSGLHVMIISGFSLFLLSLLRIKKRLQYLIAIGIAVVFVLLSGAHLSAVRACIMLALLLIGRIVGRESDPVNSLCAAGFFIVLYNVYAIMDIGFLMSFSATMGILLVSRRLCRFTLTRLKLTNRIVIWMMEVLCVSFAANLFLIPIYVLKFGVLSVICPLTNLLITIPGTFILSYGVVLTVLLAVPIPDWLMQLLCYPQTVAISVQNEIVTFLGRLPFATIGLDYPAIRVWLLLSLFAVIAGVCLHKRRSITKQVCLFVVVCFVLANAVTIFSTRNRIQIYLLNDGKFASIVVMYQFRTTVITYADDNYLDKQVYQFLKMKGVSSIDNLLILGNQFDEYKDTLFLVDNLTIQNVLYNNKNTNSLFFLEGHPNIGTLVPIKEAMNLSINNEIQIQTNYVNSKINAAIYCYETKVSLTSTPLSPDDDSAIILLRGQTKEEIPQELQSHTIVLDQQYQPAPSAEHARLAQNGAFLTIYPDGIK